MSGAMTSQNGSHPNLASKLRSGGTSTSRAMPQASQILSTVAMPASTGSRALIVFMEFSAA
jgi:hypothetical protein